MKVKSREPKESITIKLTQAEAAALLKAIENIWQEPVSKMRQELLALGIVMPRS
ncbi:MAG TPA: hypothetical protein VF944_04565 [Candidatus Bathyarchaeia archaeon]